ncbi:hypothetical protein M422DRAFT_45550 [Sphaerobolus stellatus SS14]|uniref:Uncharacterized protein n=1 Tax=Sphaerobolus stellatus (strain SS14) TaxID=990650 RepID=A0A0C9UVV8_SPHS4|nr:hypothetical protein M422DRAFT_45550 [Sphaerobolus stellatus SS14]
MPIKAYSSFFFPQVNKPKPSTTTSGPGRSFLSFDNADSIFDDDDQSVSTSTSMSSFIPSVKSCKLSRPRPSLPTIKTQPSVTTRTSNSSLRAIPSPKPAPRTHLPSPPRTTPFSAPASRTTYAPSSTPRPYTTPSKQKPQRPIRRDDEPLFEPPSPVESFLVSLPPSTRPPGTGHHRRISSSTVSTSYRATRRAHALASLEGRTATTAIPVQLSIPVHAKSFMPLSDFSSDDEDEETDEEGEVDDAERSILPLSSSRKSRAASTTIQKRKTIDSWFVGSPSDSPTPSIFSDADSDESFDSRPYSERQTGVTRRSSDFVDFADVVWEGKGSDVSAGAWAWDVAGEKKPSWLREVLEDRR